MGVAETRCLHRTPETCSMGFQKEGESDPQNKKRKTAQKKRQMRHCVKNGNAPQRITYGAEQNSRNYCRTGDTGGLLSASKKNNNPSFFGMLIFNNNINQTQTWKQRGTMVRCAGGWALESDIENGNKFAVT